MAKKRKMSAKQARYFAPRRRSRARARSVSTRRRRKSSGGRGGLSKYIPSGINNAVTRFGSGLSMPFVLGMASPVTEKIRPWVGDYADEVTELGIGLLAYNAGSGFVRDGGAAYADHAFTNAGIQTYGKFIGTNAAGNGGQDSDGYV